jgi:methionine-rich copper-binding protein CopC
MKALKKLLFAIGFLTAGIDAAHAHAFLDSAVPAVGSTVQASPTEVKIWFTRKIVSAGTNIKVLDATGVEVDLKDDKLDPGDPFLMIVSVPTLKAGTYKVIWNAVCLDTHHTTGTFTFTVSGP